MPVHVHGAIFPKVFIFLVASSSPTRGLGMLHTPFTSSSEWKLKMIPSLKRQGLYEVSIGAGEESYEDPSDWLNDYDREIGAICLAISPCMQYLIDSVEYPKDL